MNIRPGATVTPSDPEDAAAEVAGLQRIPLTRRSLEDIFEMLLDDLPKNSRWRYGVTIAPCCGSNRFTLSINTLGEDPPLIDFDGDDISALAVLARVWVIALKSLAESTPEKSR